jgi:hypothetical protein
MATDQEELQQWVADNPWFNASAPLQHAAIGIEAHLAAFGVPLKQRLAHTTRVLQRGLDPEDDPARRAYAEMTRVDAKFGQRITEDEYVAATKRR